MDLPNRKALLPWIVVTAATVLAPDKDNLLIFAQLLLCTAFLLSQGIKRANRIFPYPLELNLVRLLENRWITLVLTYVLWQLPSY